MLKFGMVEVLEVTSGDSQRAYSFNKAGHRAVFHYEPRPGFVYVRSRAISSRCNDNFDMFPAEEIEKSWRSFIGKPVFVNHHNADHRRARGVVIDAALHRDRNPDGSPDTWTEVLMEIDGLRFPRLARALLAGQIDRTSMGCDVKISVCSICRNQATTPLEYCHHIPGKKGQRVYVVLPDGRKEGRLVYEECRGLSFFENSVLVEPPADPTAFFLGKVETGSGLEHLHSAVQESLAVSVTASRVMTDRTDRLVRAASRTWANSTGNVKPNIQVQASPVWSLLRQAAWEDQGYPPEVRDAGYLHTQEVQNAERRPTDLSDPASLHRHMAEQHTGYLRDGMSHDDMQSAHTASHDEEGPDWPGAWTDDGWLHAHAGFEPREAVKPQKPVSQMSDEEYGAHQEAVAKGNAEGKQWNVDHPISHKHIVDHWNRATADEKTNGENWYRDAHHLARHIANDTGQPMHTMAGLMSNYSPQTHWATNIMNAAKVARTKQGMGGPGSGIMATSLQKKAADRMIGGEHYDSVLGGPKTKAFAHLIEHGGNSDPSDPKVVVDRHALSVAAGARATDNAYGQSRLGTKGRYHEASQAYHKAAKQISKAEGRPIEAHQVQAATWLVRQRLNEQHDSSLSATVTTSRSGTRARGAIKEWNEYAAEHHPGAMGKEPGTGYSAVPEDVKHAHDMADEGKTITKVAGGQHISYGETKAPQDVDTLRDENCPICGNDSAFDGRECQVCGYIAPPKAFGDPDVEKAKQLDSLKQDIEDQNAEVDPSRKGAPMGDDIQRQEDVLEGDDTQSPWLECSNCGTQLRPATPQTSDGNVADDAAATGPTEGDICPVCQKGQLVSSGQSEDEDDNGVEDDQEEQPDDEDDGDEELDPDEDTAIGDGKLPASKSSRTSKYRSTQTQKEKSMRPALQALAEQQKLIDEQRTVISHLLHRDQVHSSQIQRLAAGLQTLASHGGAEVEGRVKVAMIQKRADEQNPAQPIPEPAPEPPSASTVETKTPEAFADVTAPGMVPGSNNDVAADAVSTAYTPGQDIPSPGVNHLVDVTRPIDGTQGPRPLSETKTEVDVRTGNPMNPQVAYPVGGPFANAQRTGSLEGDGGERERVFAAQRLARLRIASGIADGDDLVQAQAIVANASMSIQQIKTEIETLTQVSKAAARRPATQPQQARPGLVPRSASVQRTVPVMGSSGPVGAGMGSSEIDPDLEAIFMT